MRLGIDLGSKNIGYAIIDDDKIVVSGNIEHNGVIVKNLKDLFEQLKKDYNISKFGITGNISITGFKIIDPILTGVEANRFLKTKAQNILYIGCETYSLTILDENGNYIEHAINSDCASGTGSFIDQQAERLGFSTSELSEKAYNYKESSPSIATRCAVFAKSDIIHAQAQGFTKEAIAKGICEGVARSIVANIVKGRELNGILLLIGGVSKNKKIVEEISKLLKKDVIVIQEGEFFGAIGSASLATHKIEEISYVFDHFNKIRDLREALTIRLSSYPEFLDKTYIQNDVEITIYQEPAIENHIYIGIDIGSTSTKAIITDRSNNVIIGLYTKTKGYPVEAVHTLFEEISKIFKDKKTKILGIGTTGSGRDLISKLINADFVINEISAHAKAAIFIDPKVDTIIEIGGQDSKFTRVKDGIVTNAVMNYVCAAGTGSFIEEQAKRLNINLNEIADLAEGKKAPFTSDRCTVYMERDLNIFLSEGWNKSEIIASVLFSVRDNYLSKVVGRAPLGDHLYFQGATARNKALVAVFENEIGKPITVSKYCHLTGALGLTIYMNELGIERKEETNMEFSYKTENEICTLCANHCDLRIYKIADKTIAWGMKCGREYESKKYKPVKEKSLIENRFFSVYHSLENKNINYKIGSPTIALPAALFMYEYLTIFKETFEELGIKTIIQKSSKKMSEIGRSLVNSDFCAPLTLTHGIAASLLSTKADYIFFPTILSEQNILKKFNKPEMFLDKMTDSYFCYYSQYAPIILENLSTLDMQNKLISPKLVFNNTPLEENIKALSDALLERISIEFPKFQISEKSIGEAFKKSLKNYEKRKLKWINLGKEILKSKTTKKEKDKLKILIIGRPYSVFDKNINLGIPIKIEEMGYEIIYQSMLDFQELSKKYKLENTEENITLLDKMHWYFGQQILIASKLVVERKDIYPVYLSCFRCSPDSYLLTYFKEIMDKHEKPYLVIQLDEHASDVGYQTRIEAGIETFKKHFFATNKVTKQETHYFMKYKNDKISNKDIILIPYLSPVITSLQKKAFEAFGYRTVELYLEKKMINRGYKYASGGECLPNIAIIGSILEALEREKIKPKDAILYLPTICMGCNFNQYTILTQLATENSGLNGLRISNPNAAKKIPELPKELNVALLQANILGSILYKLYYRIHPYEIHKGDTDKALENSILLIGEYYISRGKMTEAASKIRSLFENIKTTGERRPIIGVLGDFYLKYNSIMNDDIYSMIEELGGEVLMPSFTETIAHFIDADIRENGLNKKFLMGLTIFEKRFEKIFKGIIDDSFEPSIPEMIDVMKEYGIRHFIAGETTLNVSRMLYYIKHGIVDAVVHLNPIYCCPGVVSASIFRKIQKDFNIPIIDLFYDGTNKPNSIIVPHLYYLKNKKN